MDFNTRRKYYNRCEFLESLAPDDARNLDIDTECGPQVRGANWTERLANTIELSDKPVFVLFTGLPGSGKSTELRRLSARLADPARCHFLPVLVDAEANLDLTNRLDVPDIIAVILHAAERAVLEAEGKNPEASMEEGYFRRLWQWLARTDVEIGKAEFALPGSGPKLVAEMRSRPSLRAKVRATIANHLSTFLEDARHELEVLNDRAAATGREGGLVVIVDSLEKARGTSENWKDVLSSVEQIFAGGAPYLRLPVHVLYTIPTALVSRRFESVSFLPMIKLASRDGTPFAPGLLAARELIRRRIPDDVLAQLLGPDYEARVHTLIGWSGGYPRELVRLLQIALTYQTQPLSDPDFQRIFNELKDAYRKIVPADTFDWLARVAQEQYFTVLNDDHRQTADLMLSNNAVLRYVNDNDWFDLHPAVAQIPGVQAARAALLAPPPPAPVPPRPPPVPDADAGLHRFVTALALGDGFQVHLAVCRSPRQVRALLAHLEQQVPALRGDTLRIDRIAPYEALGRSTPLNGAALTRLVTERLEALAPPAADQRLLVALDATLPDTRDLPAWAELFCRLNERRNALGRQLRGALVLCLAEPLEALFAREAPDFWSLRGVSLELAAGVLEADDGGAEAAPGLVSERTRGAELLPAEADPDAEAALRAELTEAQARVAAQPDDLRAQRRLLIALGRLGDYWVTRGDSTAALACFEQARSVAEALVRREPDNPDGQFDLGIALERIGDIRLAHGDLAASEAAYRARHTLIETLTHRDPANTAWQRDLAVSHTKIGNVLLAQGDGPAALAAYRAGLAIAETLARRDPANTQWQRDLSVSHEKIGDVLLAQGDGPAALEAYRERHTLAESLARRDPANTQWRRDLVVSHGKIGDVLVAQGDGPAALATYRAGLAITETLARRDPANTQWQRDLSVSHEKIGDVLLAQGDGPAALAAYRAGLAIAETLARRDPANTQWQRDLSLSHERIGDVLRAQGDGPAALKAYRAGLVIAEFLARRDPANTQWQRDLFVSHDKIGDVLRAQGDGPAALKAYRAGLAIAETLARRDPANTEWQRDLSISHEKIGDVLVAQGDGPAALKAYRAGLAIRETLARRDPGNAQWQVDLAASCGQLGTTSALPVAERRAFLLRGREIQQRLKAAGRLAPAQDWIAHFDADLAKLPAAD